MNKIEYIFLSICLHEQTILQKHLKVKNSIYCKLSNKKTHNDKTMSILNVCLQKYSFTGTTSFYSGSLLMVIYYVVYNVQIICFHNKDKLISIG